MCMDNAWDSRGFDGGHLLDNTTRYHSTKHDRQVRKSDGDYTPAASERASELNERP